jgi:hypothetical protein
MGTINVKRERPRYTEKAHLNWMGGESYDIGNPLKNLVLAASSCFFGEPMYYHRDSGQRKPNRRCDNPYALSSADVKRLRDTLDAIDPVDWRGLSPRKLMEKAIDDALDYDAEATLQIAVDLRNRHYIRTTPQVILVRAANHKSVRGTGLVRDYAPEIIKRADEPSVCLAYQLDAYGRKRIPNSLKKALRDKLASFNEYQLGKYRMESRVVKTVDVVNLVHPVRTPAIDKLVKGELTVSGKTWEAIRSAGGSWEEALEVMGHMALLRNLRNLEQAGVNPDLYLNQLVEGVEGGKQLPFRYYSAYKACESAGCGPDTLDAIHDCLGASMGHVPRFNGKVMSLCDNSGSAWGTCTSSMGTMHIAEIANLTGVITGKAADKGYVGIFGDRLDILPITKTSSIFDLTKKCESSGRRIGGGTENGIWIFWRDAIKNRDKYDHVFVYSDMQAGHGGLFGCNPTEYRDYLWKSQYGYNQHIDVAKLVQTYRQKVNPNVNVYLVQVAGYQDTIMPEFYNKTYILGGWGDGILRFAAEMAGMQSQ